ncbi:MAG TPA: LysR family transcriptional regulator [Rhodocyclaceae bacterium]
MDIFKQIEAFVQVATRGGLSAAADGLGVTPAMVGRRLDALEARLGVKLMQRTTRRMSLTFEGQAFLEDCQRILHELANAEASVSLGGVKASGHIRMTAPAGFGRRHVAPLLRSFLATHAEVTVNLDLADRLVDLVNESIDCAIRVGELSDSNLVSIRLAENRRLVVASPAYLARRGQPQTPDDLARHNCLSLGEQRGWLFADRERPESGFTLKVAGNFECNDGAVLHEWALAGEGLAWRSLWEVGEDLAAGRLVPVLEDWATPPLGIYAVFPQRRYLPLRVRLLIDFLKNTYGNPDYWT